MVSTTQMEHTPSKAAADSPWRGFHHVAFITPDIDATVRFYAGVLGMTAGEISTSSKRGAVRNCFVYPGAASENGAAGIHFFEDAGLRDEGDLADPADREPEPGMTQHIAFSLPDSEEAAALRGRLEEAGGMDERGHRLRRHGEPPAAGQQRPDARSDVTQTVGPKTVRQTAGLDITRHGLGDPVTAQRYHSGKTVRRAEWHYPIP